LTRSWGALSQWVLGWGLGPGRVLLPYGSPPEPLPVTYSSLLDLAVPTNCAGHVIAHSHGSQKGQTTALLGRVQEQAAQPWYVASEPLQLDFCFAAQRLFAVAQAAQRVDTALDEMQIQHAADQGGIQAP